MSSFTMEQYRHLALFSDWEGTVTRIIHHDAGLPDSPQVGTSFLTTVDNRSLEKAQNFLSVIQRQGAAFDWELNVRAEGAIRCLHFCRG